MTNNYRPIINDCQLAKQISLKKLPKAGLNFGLDDFFTDDFESTRVDFGHSDGVESTDNRSGVACRLNSSPLRLLITKSEATTYIAISFFVLIFCWFLPMIFQLIFLLFSVDFTVEFAVDFSVHFSKKF